jgi:transmembrane sensor
MEHTVHSRISGQIYEEACAWFVECRADDLDDAGRRELDRWLRKSPEHLSAYIEIAAIWNEGPSLDADGKWSVDRLIEQATHTAENNVVPLPGVAVVKTDAALAAAISRTESLPASCRTRVDRKPRFSRWRRLSIVASIVGLTILAGTWRVLNPATPVYASGFGEQRSIQFEDGSIVELDSGSKIRVHYSNRERDVELIEGQALFHVAHDASRPFIVAVGATRVRAVGTQFDVYKKPDGAVVTVVEGRVTVYSSFPGGVPALPVPEPTSSAEFSSLRKQSAVPTSAASAVNLDPKGGSSLVAAAGEQVTVIANAAQKILYPNIAGVTAWRERRIVFDTATLAEVAEKFNRYNRRQLVIADPRLYGFHLSGVFSSTDLESLVTFLRERPGVKVIETSSTIRIERSEP